LSSVQLCLQCSHRYSPSTDLVLEKVDSNSASGVNA
jgi:hypothetical protein